MSETAEYPASGIRGLIATWLRSPLERAYLEGYRKASEDHRDVIRSYERALRDARN